MAPRRQTTSQGRADQGGEAAQVQRLEFKAALQITGLNPPLLPLQRQASFRPQHRTGEAIQHDSRILRGPSGLKGPVLQEGIRSLAKFQRQIRRRQSATDVKVSKNRGGLPQSGLKRRHSGPEAGIDLEVRAAQIQIGANRSSKTQAQSRSTEPESIQENSPLLGLQPGGPPLTVHRQGCIDPHGFGQLDLTIDTPLGLTPRTCDPKLQRIRDQRAGVRAANVSTKIKAAVQGDGS